MFDALPIGKLRRIIHPKPTLRPMYANRPLPDAISHRGLSTSAPENSIPAFLAAMNAGADGIELDVHASSDGVVYVHHDPAIVTRDGDPGVARALASMDSAEISKVRLPGDVVIPTLDATLELVGTRTTLFVEIKAAGIENDVVRCLRRHDMAGENCAVHAFDHRIVKRMLELMPSIRTGLLQVAYPISSCAVMRAAGASDLWQHVDFVDSSLVADVHACGGRVIVWTANSARQWEALAKIGVDGICTDHVDDYVVWRRNHQ